MKLLVVNRNTYNDKNVTEKLKKMCGNAWHVKGVLSLYGAVGGSKWVALIVRPSFFYLKLEGGGKSMI